ncbi:MAG: HAD family hydrolase [Patescibacteria group bacterium]
MKYKALMLDVDGTLIPYEYDALPSNRVADAIKKAKKKVIVCLVTGRSYGPQLEKILKKLEMSDGYVVSDTGGHVVNLATKKELYDQPINSEDLQKITGILFRHHILFYAKTQLHEDRYARYAIKQDEKLQKAYMIYSKEHNTSEEIEAVLKELSGLSTISVNKTLHKSPDKYGLNIMHVNATKLHGVEIIMKATGIKKEEIIGIGDSYNDFPLLMASGLKVAMGNGVDELKAIADYVAPSVLQDGVADVIDKYILS